MLHHGYHRRFVIQTVGENDEPVKMDGFSPPVGDRNW